MTTKRDTTVFEDIFGQDTGDALQAKLEAAKTFVENNLEAERRRHAAEVQAEERRKREAEAARLRPDRRGYTWSNVVGNDLSAVELVELARASGQPLADWLRAEAAELYGADDLEGLDFDRLAAELAHDARGRAG